VGRTPGLMLGIDEPLRVLDAELAQHLPVGAPGTTTEQQRAIAGGELGIVATEGRPMPGGEQLVVPGELDECVAPVEEDGLDHSPG
jgi:hypothetical protein